MTATSDDDRKAIGLYAVLARDAMDFMDMIAEASDATLQTLFLMLNTPNAEHDADTIELNKIGADLVGPLLDRRGIDRPVLKIGGTCSHCSRWARTDGRMTNHHPRCPAFKEFRYVRVALHGGGIYTQPLDQLDVLQQEITEASPGQRWTVEAVDMTLEEFERMPEFAGH